MPKKVLRKRHIAKAISWRIVGTIDTVIISWILTGNPFSGLKMGLGDTLTKMVLYYFHERVWVNIDLQKKPNSKKAENVTLPKH